MTITSLNGGDTVTNQEPRNQWKMLSKMIAVATTSHDEQFDKGGKPYILHPLRLMSSVDQSDAELMQIAVGHDVVEDDDSVTFEVLEKYGFSQRVIHALRLLTHDKDIPYYEYIIRIKTNRDATEVKMRDLKDNSDITRLKGISKKDFDRIQKYHMAYLFLSDKICLEEYESLNEEQK